MAGKVKEALDAVEKEVIAVADTIEIKLKEAKEGIMTVFHKLGSTEFKDGVAEVTPEVADTLKETGITE